MTWFNQQVLKTSEAHAKNSSAISARFNTGDHVKVWLDEQPDGSDASVEGYVVGIRHSCGYVLYDIAVEIGQTGFYAVLNSVHGYVTPPHFKECPPEYRLVEITKEVEENLRKQGFLNRQKDLHAHVHPEQTPPPRGMGLRVVKAMPEETTAPA